MKMPVYKFQEEVLTDAPLPAIRARLGSPGALASLKGCQGLRPLEEEGEELALRWHHVGFGFVEEGTLRVRPHERGAHLRLDGRLKGWGAFLVVAWTRWRTERLLERFVREI